MSDHSPTSLLECRLFIPKKCHESPRAVSSLSTTAARSFDLESDSQSEAMSEKVGPVRCTIMHEIGCILFIMIIIGLGYQLHVGSSAGPINRQKYHRITNQYRSQPVLSEGGENELEITQLRIPAMTRQRGGQNQSTEAGVASLPLLLIHSLHASRSAPLSHSPTLTHFLTRQLVIGVMGHDRPRIEMITATWGKYINPNQILFYADTPWPENPAVINLKHPRPDAPVTDHRGSAWKILPAVRHMYEHAPADALWFYLCDDDSVPLIHMLATLISDYDSTQDIYAGESTGQNYYMRAYYQDEEASGKVGRVVQLTYQCTGGGVIFSRAMLEKLVPVLDACPVFFASDVSLGYCVKEYAHVNEITKITTIHHAYPRTPEEIERKYNYHEPMLSQALAFHHMKPSFIYDDAKIPSTDSAEQYMLDTESRFYPSWIHQIGLLRLKEQQNDLFAQTQQLQGVAPGSMLKGSVQTQTKALPASIGYLPLIRVGYVHVQNPPRNGSRAISPQASFQENMERLLFTSHNTLPFGAGLFSPHAFQTDYIRYELDSSDSKECDICQLAQMRRQELPQTCVSNSNLYATEMFERMKFTHTKQAVPDHGRSYGVDEIDWSIYDLVISTMDIFPSDLIKQFQATTVFLHATIKEAIAHLDIVDINDVSKCNMIYHDTLTITSGVSQRSKNDSPDPENSSERVVPFPMATPFSFTFYGLLDLFQRSSVTISAELLSITGDSFHWRPATTGVLLDRPLSTLHDQTRATLIQGGTTEGYDRGVIARVQRTQLFQTAQFCIFTAGLTNEWPIPTDMRPILDDIYLAITCGCHTFFSSRLVDSYPFLHHLSPTNETLSSLNDFVTLIPKLTSNPSQPFPNRLGYIQVGQQRARLNGWLLVQPMENILKVTSQQLFKQRKSTDDVNEVPANVLQLQQQSQHPS